MTDLNDIPFVIQDINKQMPKISETSVAIPNSFSRGMPTNLMERAKEVNHKSNNNIVSIIEEIAYRYPTHLLPKIFKQYQNRIFKADLIHDSFFKHATNFDNKTKNRQHNNPFFFVNKVNGATIETLSSTNDGSPPTNTIYASKLLSVATVGQYYNQIAPAMFGSGNTGNNGRVGCYDDNGSTEPNNLLGQSSSFANDGNSAYVFHAVPEFSVTTAILWLAIVGDGSGFIPALTDGSGGTGLCYTNSLTFGSMPSPWGSFSTYSHKFRLKIGHT